MSKLVLDELANFFGSTRYIEAGLKGEDGRALHWLVLASNDANEEKLVSFKAFFRGMGRSSDIPDLICIAPFMGDWIYRFFESHSEILLTQESLKVISCDSSYDGIRVDQANQCREYQNEKNAKVKILRERCSRRGTLFLLAENVYGPVLEHLKFKGEIHTVDLTFRFIKTNHSIKWESIASMLTPAFLVDEYIKAIESIGAQEPYSLAGFSFGGYIAIEIAKKLRLMGKEVSLVVMFDTLTPESTREVPFFRRMLGHVHGIKKYGFGHIKQTFRNVSMRHGLIKHTASSDTNAERSVAHYADRDIMRMFYNSPKYDGNVLLARSSSKEHYIPWARDYGWGRYLSNLNVVKFKGSHDEFMTLEAENIASVLDENLSQSDTKLG